VVDDSKDGDSGEYRNASSEAIHAFIGRDGTHPELLRERGRGELASCPATPTTPVPRGS